MLGGDEDDGLCPPRLFHPRQIERLRIDLAVDLARAQLAEGARAGNTVAYVKHFFDFVN